MAGITERMIRAAKLDIQLYEEVEADKGAMGQAMTVVVLSSLAAGIGSAGLGGVTGLIGGAIGALVGWFIWAFLTYFIGTKILPEEGTEADLGQLLRVIGFSSSPGILRIIGLVPFLSGIIFLITGVWMLVAFVIAVRQALDYKSTGRAIGVCIIGWLIQAVIMAFILILAGAISAT